METVAQAVATGESRERLVELTALDGTAASVDREKRIIRDVAVIGAVSKNGRRYDSVLPSFPKIAEGARVNLNHVEDVTKRDIRDFAGVLTGVYYDAARKQCRASELRVNEGSAGDTLLALAASAPTKIGMSIDAVGTFKEQDGVKVATAFHTLYSVDIVDRPASVTSLHESQRVVQEGPVGDEIDRDEVMEKLRKVWGAVQSLVGKIIWPSYGEAKPNAASAAKSIKTILADGMAEVQKFIETGEVGTGTTEATETNMATENKTQESATAEDVQRMRAENADLKAKLDTMTRATERQALIVKLWADNGLSDADKAPALMKLLESAPTPEIVEQAIKEKADAKKAAAAKAGATGAVETDPVTGKPITRTEPTQESTTSKAGDKPDTQMQAALREMAM